MDVEVGGMTDLDRAIAQWEENGTFPPLTLDGLLEIEDALEATAPSELRMALASEIRRKRIDPT